MKAASVTTLFLGLASLGIAGCETHAEERHHHEPAKIVSTSPIAKDLTLTQEYVCQIHSQRHIDIRVLETGYLEQISIKEGQAVKQGDLLFSVNAILYQSKLDADRAEAQVAQMKYDNTKRLFDQKIAGAPAVAKTEVLLAQAELNKAQAKVKLAQAELDFATVKAPFDGIVDRLQEQQGSLVEEGAVLTTLSDNGTMWVYFNVPEARYLEYMATPEEEKQNQQIELVLANGMKFPQQGKIGAIEAQFNNETGNIAFRADFPNPDRLLRHGQTGNILISRLAHDALVIPQRATFEVLDKQYVYVIGEDGVVHPREVEIANELEDIFVIEKGLAATDKIVLEGVAQVRDGDEVESEFRSPEEALANQKFHAE